MDRAPTPPNAELAAAAGLLRQECRHAADTMNTVDNHPGRSLAAGGELRGLSAEHAQRAEAEADALRPCLNELRRRCDDVPDSTDGLGEDAARRLARLLTETEVALNAAGSPCRAPDEPIARRPRLPDFAAEVAARAERLRRRYDELDAAYRAIAELAAEVGGDVDELVERSLQHALTGDAELARLRHRGAELIDAGQADPLAAVRDERLSGLRAELGRFADRLSELDAERGRLPRRMERLRGDVADLAEAETAARRSHEQAASKVAGPLPSRPDPLAADLDLTLRKLENRMTGPQWHGLLDELAELETRVGRAVAECRGAAEETAALLSRRFELRGRLAAYTRKAARIGVIENPRVAASAAEATRLLGMAPCDLREAADAVDRLRREISGAQEAPA